MGWAFEVLRTPIRLPFVSRFLIFNTENSPNKYRSRNHYFSTLLPPTHPHKRAVMYKLFICHGVSMSSSSPLTRNSNPPGFFIRIVGFSVRFNLLLMQYAVTTSTTGEYEGIFIVWDTLGMLFSTVTAVMSRVASDQLSHVLTYNYLSQRN